MNADTHATIRKGLKAGNKILNKKYYALNADNRLSFFIKYKYLVDKLHVKMGYDNHLSDCPDGQRAVDVIDTCPCTSAMLAAKKMIDLYKSYKYIPSFREKQLKRLGINMDKSSSSPPTSDDEDNTEENMMFTMNV